MAPPRFTPWTPEEDRLLTEAVAACLSNLPSSLILDPDARLGGTKICWKHVAKSMTGMVDVCLCLPILIDRRRVGRDNKACRKRWIHSLDPKLRKGTSGGALLPSTELTLVIGRWSSSEDQSLLEAVKKHGKRWYEVAKDLPGRTDDQCAKRYKEAVDPAIREL